MTDTTIPRLSVPLNVFSGFYDRYVTEGYANPSTLDEQLAAAQSFQALSGVELVGRSNVDDAALPEVRKKLADSRLQVSLLIADLWGRRQWKNGSLTAADAKIRSLARDEIKRSMEWAAELECETVNLWLGQDGYDYPMTGDFLRAWDYLVEGIKSCAASHPEVKLAIEYKLKEPRTHCYVATVGKTLLLTNEIGSDNVGGLLDTGHALLCGENPAESAALLHRFGRKLMYVHLNDNWRSWDDDMLVASVHIPEFIEFFGWLDRIEYDGWIGFDIYPFRENTRDIVAQSIEWTLKLDNAARMLDTEEIMKNIRRGDSLAAAKAIYKILR